MFMEFMRVQVWCANRHTLRGGNLLVWVELTTPSCTEISFFVLSQVFYDLMREIRARKMEAIRQNNGKQNKNRKKKKCVIL